MSAHAGSIGGHPRQEEAEGYESGGSADSDGIVLPKGPPPQRANQHTFPAGWTPPLPPGPTPSYAFRVRPDPSRTHGQPTTSVSLGPGSSTNLQNHLPSEMQAQHSRSAQMRDKGPHSAAASSSATFSGAVISAEPQLRDLKKEVTAFVPTAVRKKKEAAERSKGQS